MSLDPSRHLGRLVRLSRRRPVVTLLVWLVLLVSAGVAASRLEIDPQIDSLAPADDAGRRTLQQVLHDFHLFDEVLILIEPEHAESSGNAGNNGRHGRAHVIADALVHAVMNDETASQLVLWADHREEPDIRRFVEQVMVDRALLYVDDDGLGRLRERLTPEGMSQQMSRNEAMIAAGSPAADRLSREILRDPLRLHEIMLESLRRRMPSAGGLAHGGGAASTDDGPVLVRIRARSPATDMAFARRLMTSIDRIVAATAVEGVRIQVGGAYAIARESERHIRLNMQVTLIGTVVLLHLLMLAVHRRISSVPLALLPAASGVLLAFGLHGILFESMSPLVAGVGAILAGLGVDYAIHFLEHEEARRAMSREDVAREDASFHAGLLHACLTTVIGFLALTASSIPAMRGFALFGAAGLLGSLLATCSLLPALLVLSRRSDVEPISANVTPRRHALFSGLLDSRRSPSIAAAVFVLTLIVAVYVGVGRPWFESDLTSMHPRPNPPLEAQQAIAHALGLHPEPMIIHMQAADDAALLSLSAKVARTIDTKPLRELGVIGCIEPSLFIPDQAAATRRLNELERWDRTKLVDRFDGVISESPFDASGFAAYREYLARLTEPPMVPTLDDLRRRPGLARSMLPRLEAVDGARQALALMLLERAPTDRESRHRLVEGVRSAIADLPGVTLVGMNVVAVDTEQAVRHDLPLLAGIAMLVVVGWVVVIQREARSILLTLVPVAATATAVIIVIRLAGIGFNMINLAALPILAGAAIDSGIFLVSAVRHGESQHDSRSVTSNSVHSLLHRLRALSLCSLTTIIGFGSLLFASVPALASLGAILAAGMAGCWAASVFIVAPLLARR